MDCREIRSVGQEEPQRVKGLKQCFWHFPPHHPHALSSLLLYYLELSRFISPSTIVWVSLPFPHCKLQGEKFLFALVSVISLILHWVSCTTIFFFFFKISFQSCVDVCVCMWICTWVARPEEARVIGSPGAEVTDSRELHNVSLGNLIWVF